VFSFTQRLLRVAAAANRIRVEETRWQRGRVRAPLYHWCGQGNQQVTTQQREAI